MAAELAEGGMDVVLIEEGPVMRTEDYGEDITDMMTRIMREAGTSAIVGRAPISYLEGRCVGGSTVINGGMCWRTPPRVLHRWRMEHGLVDLTPEALEPVFVHVERRIQARHQDPGSEGLNNLVFKRGCDRLGYRVVRNVRNQVHCVGTNDCPLGCPSGAKQSTLLSHVPIVLRHGGAVYSGCRVQRILVEGGRAAGVVARVEAPDGSRKGHRRLTVRAPTVVLACGATQTPLLLLRNRLCNGSGQVGRNFTLHPNVKVLALFDEEIDSLRGAHQAFQCHEFQDEGILLAPGGVPPAMISVGFDAIGREHAALMKAYRHMATGGVLVDDTTSGRVRLGPFGMPILRYDVSDHDQRRFIRAVGLLAEVYFAAGARKVFTAFRHVPPLQGPDDIRRLFTHPPRVEDTEYFTAHIMGTCRMDADPHRGVVGPTGQTHELPGLYVADASVLPTPLGVNPQETIMALATRTAWHILDARGTRRPQAV